MARLTGVLGILHPAIRFSVLDRPKSHSASNRPGRACAAICFAILVLRVGYGERVMTMAGDAVNRLLSYSYVGSQFVFGDWAAECRSSA